MIRRFSVLVAGAGLAACSSSRVALEPEDITKAAARIDASGGFVSATVATFSTDTPPRLSIGAAFWGEGSGGAGVRCSTRQAGACSVRACEPGDAKKALDSGTIAVLADDAPLVALSPDPLGKYANPAGKAKPWAPGARIHFLASGGDVPAFEATLPAPPALDVIEPQATIARLTVDRAAGVRARWLAGDAGTVRLAVRQERAPQRTALEGGVAVDCFYPRSAGAATVPPEALTDLDPSASAQVMVFATETTRVRAGDHDVLLLVNTGGVFVQAAVL
jgi:hypothetical protein